MYRDAALVAALVVVAVVAGGQLAVADARTAGQSGLEATTLQPEPINGTTVMLWGNVTVTNGTATVWFEYHRVGADGWRRTRSFLVDRTGTFVLNATDLKPATSYEYRVVAANSAGRVNGSVRSFETPPNESSPGASATGTPTGHPTPFDEQTTSPSPTPEGLTDVDATTEQPPDDRQVGRDEREGSRDVLAGWTLLLLLVAGVPVGGAVVLGGLVLALGLYERGRED